MEKIKNFFGNLKNGFFGFFNTYFYALNGILYQALTFFIGIY